MSQRRSITAGPPAQRIRIVGGNLRGSKLDVADAPGLRPTPDRVRETLFNWLAPVITGMDCLDLFAGTGALGVEAISRGAVSCVFVEREATIAAAIGANLQRLKIDNGQLVRSDAARYLAGPPRAFDLVFLDPPFAGDLWTTTAQQLETDGWLKPSAWIYVESPAATTPQLPASWTLHREGRAGDVRHALYRRLR